MAIRLDPNQEVKFEVSYLQPTFTVSYIDVQVSAAVTFPDILAVDVVTPTDLVTLSTTKGFSEFLLTTETLAQNVEKLLTETFTAADAISFQTIYTRSFFENLVSGDSYLFGIQLNKSETVNPADTLAIQFSTQLADSVNIIDMMDGDLDFFLLKVISEFSTLSDQYSIDFVTEKSDNMSLSDTGYILSQDYVEFGYFSQDYVGSGQSF